MPTQEEIDRVIESTDMVELVSPFVQLTKQGKNYKGLCPFHNEDTPSFIVSQEKHLAHCFGCGQGGSPITFLMQIKQISFHEALQELAEKAGIQLSNMPNTSRKQDYSKYYEMNKVACEFYQKSLKSTKSGLEALDYLHKRGLDDETIKMFQIGLAPKSRDSLYKVLKDANYLELDMMDIGLVHKNEMGYYDLFTRRIMFPILDENGKHIGFSGRIFENTDSNQPKYVNTKETFLYKKSTVLYHLDLAKSEILKKKRIILHEGQFDVIASARAGLKEAVCAMGTALTQEQAFILRKYAPTVIVCYDGDKAGIQASKKAIVLLKKAKLNVQLVFLPNRMDPDEYVMKYGTEAYAKYFEESIQSELDYLFEVAFFNRDIKDVSQVELIKSEIFSVLSSQRSQTLIHTYLNRLAERIGVSSEIIQRDYRTSFRRNTFTDVPEEIVPEPVFSQVQRNFETRLFLYARESKAQALQIDREIADTLDAFLPIHQKIWVTLINAYYSQNDYFNEELFCKMLNEEQKKSYFEIVESLQKSVDPFNEEDLKKCMEKTKEIHFKNERDRLRKQISQTNDEKVKIEKLTELYQSKSKTSKRRK